MTRHWTLYLALACLSASTGPAGERRVYFMGNSLTDCVRYDWFEKLADDSGHPVEYSRMAVPGAPIRWLHTHPTGGFIKRQYGPWKQALANHTWDALSFQPFSDYEGELKAAVAVARYALAKSPDLQIYWYAQWPTRQGDDWWTTWLQDHRDPVNRQRGRCRSYYEDGLLELRRRLGEAVKPVLLVPAGHAFYRLDHKMQLGLVPGFRRIWDVYADGVHTKNLGCYAVGLTFYATMLQASPVGLPVGRYQQSLPDRNELLLSPPVAQLVQETVWEAVATNPLTGVTTDAPVRVAAMLVPPAVEGSDYRFDLLPSFGKPPYRWAVKAGRLPAGVALSQAGRLAGKTNDVGGHAFTAAVTDAAGHAASKKLTLTVNPDTAPKITTRTLPPLRVGRYVEIQLQAASKNPPLTWTDGATRRTPALPVGLELTEGGLIRGTPGIAGRKDVKIIVSDGDTAGAESDAATLTFDVQPPGRDVATARKAARRPTIDGKLDPAEGWTLRYPIAKVASGRTDAKAVLDIQWDKDGIYLAVRVTDARRHFDKGSRPTGKLDGIELFLDARNNREKTFNVDDRHAVFTLGGGKTGTGSLFTIDAKGTETADGYVFEARSGWWTLGTGNGHVGKAIGIDVAVNDSVDGKTRRGQLVWHGSATNAEDPSQYRTVILGE